MATALVAGLDMGSKLRLAAALATEPETGSATVLVTVLATVQERGLEMGLAMALVAGSETGSAATLVTGLAMVGRRRQQCRQIGGRCWRRCWQWVREWGWRRCWRLHETVTGCDAGSTG